MKKSVKIISIIIAIILLCSSSLSAFAISSTVLNASSANADSLIKTQTLPDNTILKSVNMQQFHNSKMMKQRSISNDDITKALVENLGLKTNADSYASQNLFNKINEAKSVSSITQYIKVGNNGEQTIMSKDECLSAIEKEELRNKAIASRGTNASTGLLSENGYMAQIIIIVYLGNPQGKYYIVSQHEWMKQPATTNTDAFALSSNDLRWANIDEGAYTRVLAYKQTKVEDSNTTSKDVWDEKTEDPKVKPGGIFYSWNLPTSIGKTTYSNYLAQIYATAYVQNPDDLSQYLTIYSQYAHTQLGLATGFSWTVGDKPGVDISGLVDQKDYWCHYTWLYSDVYA